MKDIVIPGKTVKFALWALLACFIIACLINVGAIIAYDRPWSELFTQIGFVIFVALILWVAQLVLNLVIWGIYMKVTRK